MGATQKIGILGGGQLARMLVESAQKLKISCSVYAQSASDSVTHVTDHFVIGSLKDEDALHSFFKTVNIVTTENEFVDVDLLRRAASGLSIEFRPDLDAIRCVQDKLEQKALFKKLDLPTSRFVVFKDSTTTPDQFLVAVLEAFPKGAMLKWSRFGYDGKGNFPLKSQEQFWAAKNFIQEGFKVGARIYAEEWISFQSEMAMVTAAGLDKEFRHFPMVISEQRHSICYKVMGPAESFGVARTLIQEAEAMAKRVAVELPFVGCFAVEFFFSPEWGLKINELAPRVHNTGHHTQISSNSSQFDLHLLAISGAPLPELTTQPAFAMVNILGTWPEGVAPQTSGKIQIYSYDKESRPRRKLGHVNFIALTKNELEKDLELVESWIP